LARGFQRDFFSRNGPRAAMLAAQAHFYFTLTLVSPL